jgi:hypothetical protein
MKTLLDVANAYEDWARRNDEMAQSIIAHLSGYKPYTWDRQIYDASVLRQEAHYFRAQAERLRKQHQYAGRSPRTSSRAAFLCPRFASFFKTNFESKSLSQPCGWSFPGLSVVCPSPAS